MEKPFLEKIKHFCNKHAIGGPIQLPELQFDVDCEGASVLLQSALQNDEPLMDSRFGNIELRTLYTYISSQQRHSAVQYVLGKQQAWWYKDLWIYEMENNTGFFPTTPSNLDAFSQLYLADCKEIDILGSWNKEEIFVAPFLKSDIKRIWISWLEPFWSVTPYTAALRGKKVLVVHPFSDTISGQYQNRNALFSNADILPDLATLEVIPAVQSMGGRATGFKSWFECLDYMKKEIDKHDFDVCLIGCGAYGLPLAAHVKRMGKKGIHIGGALQLLFGITGQRWIDMKPFVMDGITLDYSKLPNEHWVRPQATDRPANYKQVEGGCYW